MNYTSWTHHSPECRLFGVLLTESGPVIAQQLGDAMDIFTESLDSHKKDPELRLKYEITCHCSCTCMSVRDVIIDKIL